MTEFHIEVFLVVAMKSVTLVMIDCIVIDN